MTLQKPDAHSARASRVPAASYPSIKHEQAAWSSGHHIVAGVDEVGRGAWAGPLVAAALVLPRDPRHRSRLTRMLNRAGLKPRDSKLMSREQRELTVDVVQQAGLHFAIAEIAPGRLDGIGLGAANKLALATAVRDLGDVDFALVDAFHVQEMHCARKAIIGGDRVCLSIALASIIAKVHRDRIMRDLDMSYPGYGFAIHKGYGTRMHAEALDSLGVCDQHRKCFRPVADRLVRV